MRAGVVQLAYDAAGNMTDDGQSYTYEYDAFGRLRRVRNRSTTDLVAEYTYNGLAWRIGSHADEDADGDVDGSDAWRRHVYDESWRQVSTYKGSSLSERVVPHLAGLGGRGGSSYIDAVVLHEHDDNLDGTMEWRRYLCQNWRADVVSVHFSGDSQHEQARYSAYGVAFGLLTEIEVMISRSVPSKSPSRSRSPRTS